MIVASTLALLLSPLLAIGGAGLVWLVVTVWRRGVVRRRQRRIERLLRAGQVAQAADEMAVAGEAVAGARLLQERGMGEAAIDLLTSAGHFLEAGRVALDNGLHRRAGELFQRGGDLASAGGCYLSAGGVEEAIRLFRQVDGLSTAARMLERTGRFEQAIRLYMETGAVEQLATLARERIGDRQLLKEAADHLRAAGSPELALPLYHKGLFHLEVGLILAQLGRTEQALQVYAQRGFYREAAALLAGLGRHRESAQHYLKGGLVSLAVEQLLAAGEELAVARLLRRSGQPDQALEVLARIKAGSKQYQESRLLRCSILAESRRHEEAAATLDELLGVIGYSTGTVEVVYRLVDLRLHLGQTAQAIEALERAKRAGVADPEMDEQLATLRGGAADLLGPDQEEALTMTLKGRGPKGSTTTNLGFPRSERYELKRKLARGGHGILFLVRDRQLDQDVVLKLLHSESLPSDLARRYFMREAKTAAMLNHPNIVQVFDYGEIERRPYLTMEYVDGQNLMELVTDSRSELPFGRKLSIAIQLCEALAYAHSHSVIHRDVKMENVMVDANWTTKLMDFGLAKALDENPDRSLFIIGTPFYMSPEQIIGDQLDGRTDIYSTGTLLFRLFSGRLPFEEGEVLSHHRFTAPPDPREYAPEIPRLLAETILTCLKKQRDERFDIARIGECPSGQYAGGWWATR